MSSVLFFIAAIGVISGAVGVVLLRNPFYSVLALVSHLLSLAVLFLLLRSEFVAAIQVVIYAGAVMVLYVFVVAYVGDQTEPLGERLRSPGAIGSQLRLGGAVLAGALLVELLIALLGTGLQAVDGKGAGYSPGPETFGTPAYIGKLLLTRFLLAFEAASFLLLIAAVGGVVLARRRHGLDEEEEEHVLTPMDLLRPRATGTMAEGVGRRPEGVHQNQTTRPSAASRFNP
ncbi:MAG TPA: NADH-quinone oxidoreductase subunit J [Solirubrobacteraceae bacterium]|nr:NADH-quinone oxidoreductase subunit J [Solirubrobacteraceae bacterium]